MGSDGSFDWRVDRFVSSHVGGTVPDDRDLPVFLSPIPTWLENVAFRLVWLLVIVNVVGTAFGFYYYSPQFAETPLIMWPIVPVSPLATLYIGLSFACWRLGYDGRVAQVVHVLGFIGCLKYGLWTVLVHSFVEDPSAVVPWLRQFLIWSHFGMALEAFLVTRYAKFSLPAISVGVGWFLLNDMLDYFVDAFGGPHHTWLTVIPTSDAVRPSPEFEMIAGFAVGMTALAIFLSVWAWRTIDMR
ncbi:DUF1405 domain-containing protein [Halovenus rubra]|uniref:DUF1405 domain-containing protein n=2 Tax=Halovenus rubra TaxID=869890 RepID=A0ACC7E4C6_9EURY|nr:DUF1405 domain-containing protein [Halovenus rubra]